MFTTRRQRFCLAGLVVVVDLNLYVAVLLRNLNFGFLNSDEADQIACYDDSSPNTLPELPSTMTPDSGIFFLETSCHSSPGVNLTPRQACAVESAAKMNPDKDVYVLFPGPVVYNATALSSSVKQLLLYPNVHLRHIIMSRYFRGSPLEEWYESGQLRSSQYPLSHASDVLRYLTLWKFGGIYLDLDVVVIKSFSGLLNFAGVESVHSANSAVLSFSRSGLGHALALQCVHELRQDFRGDDWGHNGPGVITSVLKRICGTDNLKQITAEHCAGFTLFPPKAFYPIPWWQWELYMDETRSEKTLQKLEDSYVVHVWNKFSSQVKVSVGSRQPYSILASLFCPRVYHSVDDIF